MTFATCCWMLFGFGSMALAETRVTILTTNAADNIGQGEWSFAAWVEARSTATAMPRSRSTSSAMPSQS